MIFLNHLGTQASPYLLQHANNPVDWYPWCEEAFQRAQRENKPIFLSIGYSTCHWCHVMAHESFEDVRIADILNKYYISIKVDKEERPDIDSIYMSFCQAFTGSGGWPLSIFMTPDQKPFYAGTYFPKKAHYGMVGFEELLISIATKWRENKKYIIDSAQDMVRRLQSEREYTGEIDETLTRRALSQLKGSFDKVYGGFGSAPKFPTPHNLMYLLHEYQLSKDEEILDIVEKTLMQMYRGGIFDHIGYGFSRYSTDQYFLVPHFEKMLYDNALLLFTYANAYAVTKKEVYKGIGEKIATYVIREMTSPDYGFYSAQDADSEGVEGKYYVFDYDETIKVLGSENGIKFNEYYGITREGNFEGKNIPNLLRNENTESLIEFIPKLYEYRKLRTELHLDDKILTSWNSLMIAAFAYFAQVTKNDQYLDVAKKAESFIERNLLEDGVLYVGCRNGIKFSKGFLDDYAFYIFALIRLYEASYEEALLKKAEMLIKQVIMEFFDHENGGFYLYGKDNEQLILTPKESYDGAIPSGNSVMAYNLVMLNYLLKNQELDSIIEKQLAFLSAEAAGYPAGFSFFLLALSYYSNPPKQITVVLKQSSDLEEIKRKLPDDAIISVLFEETELYPIYNNQTTFYVCDHHSCKPPSNEWNNIE